MSATTIELVIFTAKDGVSNDTVRTAAEASNRFFRRCTGYVRRELAYAPDSGQWIDIVHWIDREAAVLAAADFADAPEVAPFRDLIDVERISILRAQSVSTDQPGLPVGEQPKRTAVWTLATPPSQPHLS